MSYWFLCIKFLFPQVSKERDGKIVDGRCHSLTASYIRDRHNYDDTVPVCSFYEGFNLYGKEKPIQPGVYNLDDLKEIGREMSWCPYFLARYTVCNTFKIFLVFNLWIICSKIYFLNSVSDYPRKHNSLQLSLFIRSKDSRSCVKRAY